MVSSLWEVAELGMAGTGDKAEPKVLPLEIEHLGWLQQLVSSTYSSIWTRDRRKHHPETCRKRERERDREGERVAQDFGSSNRWLKLGALTLSLTRALVLSL